MKRLTKIRLINWHLFENITITCQGTTYFIGINGAGKSTILDAVQFALVGGQRDVRFNQAAVSGGKRTLASYVRGELGMEGQRYLRGDTTGVVALEFENGDDTFFVHGAVIDAYEDERTPDVTYFIVHNAHLDDSWFFRAPGQLHDTRAFKRHMEHFALPPAARAQLFNRVEDYRFHLMNRLGQLKESFTGKIVKGLAFSPLTDIRSFVHNYLLDEALVDVKTLQAQLETLYHFESLAANVRERIVALDRIEALDVERATQRRRRITNGFIARSAQGAAAQAELKNRRLELDELRMQLARLGYQREGLMEQLGHAQHALVEAQIALQTDRTAAREKELREKIAGVQSELGELQRLQASLQVQIERQQRDMLALADLLRQDGLPLPPALDEYAAGPTLERARSLQNSLEGLGQLYQGQSALLAERVQRLRSEGDDLQREILRLRTGDRETSYEREAPEAVRLRQLLRAQLGLGAEQVLFLCNALYIPDETWQDAVEGALGRSRFTLLLAPEHYQAAVNLYRERRERDHLHGVGLLDTERLLNSAPRSQPNALAAEVMSEHPAARAFADLLLGGIIKCDSLDELREHRTAITRECFMRRNFTTSHLNPQVYRQWFIGERSAPRQIEQREARLAAIGAELAELSAQSAGLEQRLSLTRDQVRGLIEVEHNLPVVGRIPALASQLVVFQTELAELDVQSIQVLQAALREREAAHARLQLDSQQLERQVGSLETQIQTLERETMPRLEGVVLAAEQSAGQYLQLEQAEDLRDEADKEYERRRERYPLPVIQEKAAEYERDYITAEQRSRDRLRESKQAYSFQYDFGYDALEDASRYLTEREKLVLSELPAYEARINEQRALAEQELVENFIHRLREQIEDARSQLAYLNNTLSQLRFGGERFEFIVQPEPSLRQVYDMISESQSILGMSLFESDFRQKHQQGWDLLFERLTAREDEALHQELRTLQDYRNYLQYDIRVHYPDGDRALLSKINAKKSGGETTTPFYVAMVASFAQAYRLNQPRVSDTIRLAMFDEAFGKMDTARTASVLKFMNETGLQVLLATPPDKSGALLPYVDSVRTVVRKDQHAFVIEIDKAELLRELDAG